MKKLTKLTVVLGLSAVFWRNKSQISKKMAHVKEGKSNSRLFKLSSALLLGGISTVMTAPAYAMSESAVQGFASSMSAAANAQNIGMVSRLIDDKAVISLTRNGKTTSLDKNAYLQLLQKSWLGASNYRYNISIENIVVTGGQARADVITTESWTKDGKNTTFRTHSKATLSDVGGNAILLRAVSQVTIE